MLQILQGLAAREVEKLPHHFTSPRPLIPQATQEFPSPWHGLWGLVHILNISTALLLPLLKRLRTNILTRQGNGAALKTTAPIASDSLYKGSSRLADKALLGGPASVGSQKPNYCGLQRISRSFEKQTSLHPDCGFACSGSQSLSFGEGSFWLLEKPQLIFNFWLSKPPHMQSVTTTRGKKK